ncbi:MAG: hypothetical protein ACXVA9_03345 [Bdellovibrionales bacterium]
MPLWVRRFLSRRTLRSHLQIALIIGLVLRCLCAFFVYGPQALDDYKHGVYPAYQFFAGQVLDLPDYRSHLLIWILAFFIKVGSWFGVESALGQVRAMYFGLACLSLLGILGTYLFVKTFRSKLFAATALYLVAMFPLMPFISTRAFGEAVAMSFVMLGFGILENQRREKKVNLPLWTLGFACLGVATLFRFHVGLLFVTYGAVLIYLRCWTGVAGGLIGGLLTLAGEWLVDFLSGKPPFGTLFAYLEANEGGAKDYGVSPWYNTWLFVIALSLAPFSLVFIKKLKPLWKSQWPWLLPFLIYVLAHSLVPHKEERFLYPIVGLELWALAWLWASSAYFKLARKIYSPVLIGLSVPLLFVVCLVNTQEGEIEPPAYAESHYKNVVYLDHESLFGISRIQFYFLRPPSILEQVGTDDFNANKIDESLRNHREHKAVVLLTSISDVRDQLHALEGVRTTEAQCLSMRTSGSLIDRLLYALNPKHNQRRRPTWYLVCERA